jgi:ubiquinone/menaquinone biosynthesis C-methylase UbiE
LSSNSSFLSKFYDWGELAKLRAQQSQWDELARCDPFWAVLSDPARRHGGWSTEEFFATGEREIADLMRRAQRFALPAARSAALDFGCGVGRLTQALAARFESVTGVDIAPAMIDLARRYNRHGERCRYIVNDEDDLRIFPARSFDFLCSQITLQHVPPRYSLNYLREFVRVLRPGGMLVFQLPSTQPAFLSRLMRNLPRRLLHLARVVEMHGIPRSQVESLLAECDAEVLAVEENDAAGPTWVSYRYFVTRRQEQLFSRLNQTKAFARDRLSAPLPVTPVMSQRLRRFERTAQAVRCLQLT